MSAGSTGPGEVLVLVAGRGAVAFCGLHGEPLLAHAARAAAALAPPRVLVDPEQAEAVAAALDKAGVRAVLLHAPAWSTWRASSPPGTPLLVHDSLCPLTPPAFLREVWDLAVAEPATAFAGYRPVTDTVKTAVNGQISGTIDRDRLAIVTSPVAVPAGELPDAPAALTDLAGLVGGLRARCPVRLVRAPSLARRVGDSAAVHVLECVDEVAHRVHLEGAVSGARATRAHR